MNTSRMHITRFASHLASSRLRLHEGAGLLDSFAVIAFTVSSWLTLTTLGGVYMFWQRLDTTDTYLHEHVHFSQELAADSGMMYMSFSLIALAILTIPLMSLGIGAAQLGARGRTKRLAALRLVGMTAWQTQRIALVETMVQFIIGFLIGFVLYVASLPAWQFIRFNNQPISISEMLLPWWGVLVVLAGLGIIAVLSTVLGLLQVSISPLGVARKVSDRSVRWWRIIAVIIGLALGWWILSHIPGLQNIEDALTYLISVGIALVILLTTFTIFGPLAIQLSARFGLRTKHPSRLLAARRIIDDPRRAWRSISGTVFIAFITTFILAAATFDLSSYSPEEIQQALDQGIAMNPDIAQSAYSFMLITDITTGVLIAFAFSLLLGATSTLIQQASDVFDRAGEERALVLMGTPVRVLLWTRIQQVLYPFIVSLILAIGFASLATLIIGAVGIAYNYVALLSLIGASIAVTIIPMLLVLPIERKILAQQQRRND